MIIKKCSEIYSSIEIEIKLLYKKKNDKVKIVKIIIDF